ncbi:hypothetical protein WJX73_010001 [Symbiochloris irregularis]|uniref:Uncharacterized protein n=1 Tax=Symbiochloris irregularis TaxID=706552 RepID=A0AAW1NZK2_9CHLO
MAKQKPAAAPNATKEGALLRFLAKVLDFESASAALRKDKHTSVLAEHYICPLVAALEAARVIYRRPFSTIS